MKARVLFISLSVFVAMPVQAVNFGLANVDQTKVNKKKWRCEYCIKPNKYSGSWSVTGNHITNDEPVFENIVDHDDGLTPDGAFEVNYLRPDKSARIWYSGADGNVASPGLNSGAKLDYFSGSKLIVTYRELPRFYGENGQTPLTHIGGANLILPENWVADPNSQNMPALSQSLSPINLELLREQLSLDYYYRSQSPWRPHFSVSQEKKEGVKLSSGINNYQITTLANPVDYTTTKLNTGVSYLSSRWMADLSYHYVGFDNEQTELAWQDPFTSDEQIYSLAPDNEFHQLTAQFRYRGESTQYFASGHYSQSLQDEDFTDSTITTPVKSLDGRIDETDIRLKAIHSLTRKTRLIAKLSFNERNNKTDQYLLANGLTRVNDYRNNKIDLMAQIKELDKVNLKVGARLITKDRPQQERTRIDERELFFSIKEKTYDDFDFALDYVFSKRDGSEFKADIPANNQQNELLRRFNLADRDRNKITSWFAYAISPSFNLDLNVFYAEDDYSETEIGLTDGEDKGYELTFTGMAKHLTWQLYYSRQKISYDQSGSDNLTNANWFSETDSDTKLYGFSIDFPDIIENTLEAGIEYNYTKGTLEKSVNQGLSNGAKYPENNYKQHKVDVHMDYFLSDKEQITGHIIYERNNDVDYFYHNGDVTTITNMVSSGIVGSNYNNTYISLTYKKSF